MEEAMDRMIRCAHCGCLFEADPRVKNQKYCNKKECQRARKNLWQRQKIAHDSDYRDNQRDCQREWHKRHPDYWKKYRSKNKTYAKRNRLLQRYRNTKRRVRMIATMDASEPASFPGPGSYYLVPVIATMDASAQKVILIPAA